MKWLSNIIFLCFLFQVNGSFSQINDKQKLAAYLQTKQFYAPSIGNYVELHIQYVGYTIAYIQQDDDLIGELAVIINITSEKDTIHDAYRLSTPLMLDGIVDDFYDIKRFALEPGNYQCNIELMDLNSKKESVKAKFGFEVTNLSNKVSISDLLVAETASPTEKTTAFSKSGYDIIPRISTFYPSESSAIPVYFEVYNANQLSDSITVVQKLYNTETIRDITTYTSYNTFKNESVVPVFKLLQIDSLETGSYTLEYAIFHHDSLLVSNTYEFDRVNKQTIVNTANIVLDPNFQLSITDDSVRFYLASLIPISGRAQTKSIVRALKSKNEENQRKMIQAFWSETDPINPYETWMKYKAQVYYVETLFKTNIRSGFETDRGRVYLKYGAPNRIMEREISSSEYPYEMWQYYTIGRFRNKKFIFYNPDLVNNNYVLLHSDMIGELKNPNWKYDLNRRNTTRGNVYDTNSNVQDSWGNKSDKMIGN